MDDTNSAGSSELTSHGMNMNDEEAEEQKEDMLIKLKLAHEIGVSGDSGAEVRLEEIAAKDELWSLVKEQVHSAFWDIFKEEISRVPPGLTMAFLLLKDIKESLFSVMTPNLVKLKANVDEVLDLELLKQQAEHEVIDVQNLARFIISVMSRICAPVRDENMVKLSNETDIVAIFRGILETLNLMKLDLINFTLKSITPDILSNQMEYERTKFADYIKVLDGKLPITKAWLEKHIKPGEENNVENVLYDAFLDILVWNSDGAFPETLFMDAPRINLLRREYYKLVIASSIIIITLSCTSTHLASDRLYKEALKSNISILLNGITSDETLKKIIPNIVEQIKKDANSRLESAGKEHLSDLVIDSLERQITEVVQSENKIRSLVCKRVNDYFKSSLVHPKGIGTFPLALVLFQPELENLKTKFRHVVIYNITICKPHYLKLIQESS